VADYAENTRAMYTPLIVSFLRHEQSGGRNGLVTLDTYLAYISILLAREGGISVAVFKQLSGALAHLQRRQLVLQG
jgi:hypothetical protein